MECAWLIIVILTAQSVRTWIYINATRASVNKLSLRRTRVIMIDNATKTANIREIKPREDFDCMFPTYNFKFNSCYNYILFPQRRMLVISTENTVSRFPVSQCVTHVELGQCIAIRDPHCCWCQTSHSCSHIDDWWVSMVHSNLLIN